MKKYIFSCLFLGLSFICNAQCDCYSVESISIPNDTVGIMRVGFINTCDDHVYLRAWVFNEQNDTLAHFTDCWCGAVLPLNKLVFWNFNTSLTQLPKLNTLRVAFGYEFPELCPNIRFNPLLLDVNDPSHSISLNIYPNPSKENIQIESINRISSVTLYDIQQQVVGHYNLQGRNFLEIEHHIAGMYYMHVLFDDGIAEIRKIVFY